MYVKYNAPKHIENHVKLLFWHSFVYDLLNTAHSRVRRSHTKIQLGASQKRKSGYIQKDIN